MKFTDHFINRPVLAIVLSSLILMLGLAASGKLSIRQFPEIEQSQITVVTVYPGANARTIQSYVTDPLQRTIATADGVEYVSSKSDAGASRITVHVRLGEDSGEVQTNVISKVDEARFELPRDVEDPVVTSRQSGDAMMYLSFSSDQMTIQQIVDYLRRTIQPDLSTIEGVGEAKVYTSREYAMRVWLKPAPMAALGVTAKDVLDSLREQNYISAAGSVRSSLTRTTVDAKTDMQSTDEFGAIVVRQDGDRRVLLTDVAELDFSAADFDSGSYSNGHDTVFVAITEAPDANPLDVARRVKERLPYLTARLPADMWVKNEGDISIFIEEAIDGVITTLLEAAAIVMLVTLLFLGSMRVVVVPMVAIPLSLIGVLFVIWQMGFSINLLTLLALVIAIGLVVDDAIVVVENVHRHIEDGKPPLQAALIGAREVALPVIAMTITLAAVYAPIGFMGGITGALFSEFALTLAGAVIVSGVIALTLSPMMCAVLLSDHEHETRFELWLDRRFEQLNSAYRRALAVCLDHRGAVWLFALGVLIALPLLMSVTQRELAPQEDSGGLYMVATPPDYANVEYVNHFLDQMVERILAIDGVSHIWQVNDPGRVFGGIELVPWSERSRTQFDIQREAQAALASVAGLDFFTFGQPALPGVASGLPVNFIVSTHKDFAELDQVTDELLARARASNLFIFVNKTLQYSRPEVRVNIDRDLAARLGVSMEDVGLTLQAMLGESEAGRFSLEGRSYRVIPQAQRGFRLTAEALEQFYVRASDGSMVALSTLIKLERNIEPNSRTQHQQMNSTTIQGMVMPPNTLGTALDFLDTALLEIAPMNFRSDYGGESRRYKQESGGFWGLFVTSLLLIYLVLAAQFNSFRDPFVVLISVPLSLFGAVAALAMGFATLNIYTQIGMLTLIGLISKHGILIVDFANHRVADGLDHKSAVLEAAALRLRPILMTTFATVLGVMPLLLAFGAGAASHYAIGLVITAGMLVGTLFTLFVLPTLYPSLMDRRA